MPQNFSELPQVIDWLLDTEEGERGIIVENVSSPYIVDASDNGMWEIWCYRPNDEKESVAKGKARSIAIAKNKALIAAFEYIDELQFMLPPNEQKEEIVPENPTITKIKRTLRVFFTGVLIVACFVVFAALMIRFFPRVFFGFTAFVAACLFIVHWLLALIATESERVDKLHAETKDTPKRPMKTKSTESDKERFFPWMS